MALKSPAWRWGAIALSALNFAGLGMAVGAAEPWHAVVHAVLALGFGAGAARLRDARGREKPSTGLDTLDAEVGELRQELLETQERLDFTERMLAQDLEARRVEQQRPDQTLP